MIHDLDHPIALVDILDGDHRHPAILVFQEEGAPPTSTVVSCAKAVLINKALIIIRHIFFNSCINRNFVFFLE